MGWSGGSQRRGESERLQATCWRECAQSGTSGVRPIGTCRHGLRYPVKFLPELLSSGMKQEEILADYEDLEREGLLAALEISQKPTRRTYAQPVVVNGRLMDAKRPPASWAWTTMSCC